MDVRTGEDCVALSMSDSDEEFGDSEEELELELDVSSEEEEQAESHPHSSAASSSTGASSSNRSFVDIQKEDELRSRFSSLGSVSKGASLRMMSDLLSLQKTDPDVLGFTVEPDEDRLDRWNVKLFGFKRGDSLYEDMVWYKQKSGKDYILLEMNFPSDYPFAPPFIRVVEPRFAFHSGHVTIGGSICMELLTMSGWQATCDIESTIVSIRSEINEGGGRLDRAKATVPYTRQEAEQAFQRVARQHGWQV